MTMPIIPDHYTNAPERNHFPILLQLGILSLILVGMFGALVLYNQTEAPMTSAPSYELVDLHATAVDSTPIQLPEVEVYATAAYVWDIKGQRALYKKNETDVVPLASITKLMTALVVDELETPETAVQVSQAAVRQEGGSGLAPGESLAISELQAFSLMSSSNDAAYTLAASVGALLGEREATSQFVAAMNIRASELGLNSFEFRNMTGLDVSPTQAGAVGNAKDVSFLMKHLVTEHRDILAATTEPTSRIYNEAGAHHDISNTNAIVDSIPNLIGSKTGYTDLAGGNLTVVFDAGYDRPIVITVLGSTRDRRFSDVLTLVEAVEASIGTP